MLRRTHSSKGQYIVLTNIGGKSQQVGKFSSEEWPSVTVDTLSSTIGYQVKALMEVGNQTFKQFPPRADGSFPNDMNASTYLAVVDETKPIGNVSSSIKDIDIARAQQCIGYATSNTHPDPQVAMSLGIISVISPDVEVAEIPCFIYNCTDAMVVAIALDDFKAHRIVSTPSMTEFGQYGQVNSSGLQYTYALPIESILDMCFDEADDDLMSNDDDLPVKRIIFCGHGLSGSVAHLAAVHARTISHQLALPLKESDIMAVSFSSPSLMNTAAADRVNADFAGQHLHIAYNNDCVIHACHLSMQLAAAPERQRTQLCPEIIESVGNLVQIDMSGQGGRQKFFTAVETSLRNAQDLVDQVHDKPEFLPFGVHHLFDAGHRSTDPEFSSDDPDKINEVYQKIRWEQQGCRSHAQPPKGFVQESSEILFSGQCSKTELIPLITECNILCTPGHVDVSVRGANLESLLCRSKGESELAFFEGEGPSSTAPRAPIIFYNTNFQIPESETEAENISAGAIMMRLPTKPGEVRFAISNRTLNPQTSNQVAIVIRTDFGKSARFNVDQACIKEGHDPDAATTLHNTAGLELFRSAFSRFILLSYTDSLSSQTAGPLMTRRDKALLDYLLQMESLLCDNPALQSLVDRFQQDPCIEMAQFCLTRASNKELLAIANSFAQPLKLELDSKPKRFVKRAFARIGKVVAGVLIVTAVAIAIPAGLLALPALAFRDDEGGLTGIGRVLVAPAVICSLPAIAFGVLGASIWKSSSDALRDPPSQQYMAVLGVFLSILDVNTDFLVEELTSFENAVYDKFQEKGIDLSSCDDTVLDEYLKQVADAHSGDENHPSSLAKSSRARYALVKYLQMIGKLHHLRHVLAKQIWVTFVGVHNAGKSTAIEKLFGFETHAHVLDRTEVPQVFRLGAAPQNEDDNDLLIIDMPGASDQRAEIASMSQQFGSVSTLTVCIFTAGHIARPEREIMDQVKKQGKPFIVVINKIDTVPEIQSNLKTFRRAYAATLGISESVLMFTSLRNDPNSVEALRSVLFVCLGALTNDDQGVVATKLAPPDYMDRAKGLGASDEQVEDIAIHLMENELLFSDDNIKQALHQKPLEELSVAPTMQVKRLAIVKLLISLVEDHLDIDLATEVFRLVAAKVDTDNAQERAAWSTPFEKMVDALSGCENSALMQAPLLLILAITPVLSLLAGTIAAIHSDLTDAGKPKEVIIETVKRWLVDYSLASDKDGLVALATQIESESSQKEADYGGDDFDFEPEAVDRAAEDRLLDLLRLSISFNITRSVDYRLVYKPSDIDPKMTFSRKYDLFRQYFTEYAEHAKLREIEHFGAEIDGNNIVESFFLTLASENLSRNELRSGKFHIQLDNARETVDAGGALRSTITSISQRMTDGPFEEVEPGVIYFKRSNDKQDTLGLWFRGLGRLIGMCVCQEDLQFNAGFPLVFFKLLLGYTVTLDDLDAFRPQVVKSIRSIARMNDEELKAVCLTFTVSDSSGEEIELVKDGGMRDVRRFNRNSYLKTYVLHALGKGLPLNQLILGFQDACPTHLVSIFTAAELQKIVCGNPTIDFEDLKAHHKIQSPHPNAKSVEYVLQVLSEFDQEDLSKFLVFATGNATPPIKGFSAMQPPLNFTGSRTSSVDGLLIGHTCFNQVELPVYTSLDKCRQKVLFSIQNTDAGDLGRY